MFWWDFIVPFVSKFPGNLLIITARPALLDLCTHANDMIAIFGDPYYSLK